MPLDKANFVLVERATITKVTAPLAIGRMLADDPLLELAHQGEVFGAWLGRSRAGGKAREEARR